MRQAAKQTEQDAERQRMAVLNRLLKENLEQLDAYRLQWGEDGLMYVSRIRDYRLTSTIPKDRPTRALAYMEPFLSGETTALRNLFRLSKADERLAFWKDIRSSLGQYSPSVQPISPQQVHLNKNNVLPG